MKIKSAAYDLERDYIDYLKEWVYGERHRSEWVLSRNTFGCDMEKSLLDFVEDYEARVGNGWDFVEIKYDLKKVI